MTLTYWLYIDKHGNHAMHKMPPVLVLDGAQAYRIEIEVPVPEPRVSITPVKTYVNGVPFSAEDRSK